MPKNSNTFYNHFANDKATKLGNKIAMTTAKRVFRKIDLKKGNSILEIGPGRGNFAKICKDANIEYTALEANTQLANNLRNCGFEVIEQKIPPLPEINKKFNCIVMIHFLEHIDGTSKAIELIEGLKNNLSTHGKIVVLSPDYLYHNKNFFDVDFSHSFITTKRRIEQLFVSSKLNVEFSGYMNGPLSGISGFAIGLLFKICPITFLQNFFPKNRVFQKLYKLKNTFSRSILLIAKTPE